MNSTDIDRLLPLTPAVFHILLVLAEGEGHGYSIMQAVAQQTQGRLQLGPGTLYGAIKRLLADGLIEETHPEPSEGDERRRYYRLTDFGRRVAQAEALRLAQLVRLAQRSNLLPEALGGGC